MAVAFLSVAWPTGVQLLVFFCSSVSVVLFDTPGISRCRSQHISVESSSLFHHSIYLWFICFPWWSIDELENLHADRTTVCFEPWQKPRASLGTRKIGLSHQYFNTDRSKAVLLLWFHTVTCSCCLYLYFGSDIMLVTYFVNLGSWTTTCLGKSCSFDLPRLPFVNCCQFMYLVISRLVLRTGCGIWLYKFLIIAYLYTL